MPRSLDESTDDGVRALRRLETEQMGWLTTVNPEGQPQATPIWFLWDGKEILIYSFHRAVRNENISERPRVAFNLESGPTGDDVVTMEGDARVQLDEPAASANRTYVAKYQGKIDGYGWTWEWFDERYSVPVRIKPLRWRLG